MEGKREEEERNENDYEGFLMFVAVIRISQPTYGKDVYFLANTFPSNAFYKKQKTHSCF
jgi:hypothetical protein